VRPGKSLRRGNGGNAQWGAKGKVGASPTGGAREIAQRLPPGGLLAVVITASVSYVKRRRGAGARSGERGHDRKLERPAVSKPGNAPEERRKGAIGGSVWC